MLTGIAAAKRWLPFVGTVIVVLTEVFRQFGQPGVAHLISGALRLLGVDASADQALAAAAVTSVIGLALQLKSRYDKARG